MVLLRAVLDACVLYPFSLRDTLPRLPAADLYTTANLRHFPSVACNVHGVQPTHPQSFLRELLRADGELVLDTLRTQASRLTKPHPWTLDMLLESLAHTVPEFVAEARRRIK
ncbi:MAG: hypothetical protein ACRD0K_24090 [Egibacteraceae bacterium]